MERWRKKWRQKDADFKFDTRTRPQNCVGNQAYLNSQTFTFLCCVSLAWLRNGSTIVQWTFSQVLGAILKMNNLCFSDHVIYHWERHMTKWGEGMWQKVEESEPREMCKPVATRMWKESPEINKVTFLLWVITSFTKQKWQTDKSGLKVFHCFGFQRRW